MASAIRFGLAAVKNVGHNAIESIVAGRKQLGRYTSIYRILRKGRSAAAEQARAGVADQERRHGFPGPPRPVDGRPRQRHGTRTENTARRRIRPAWPVRRVPDGGCIQSSTTKLPDTPDWDEHTRLANEKEILGFFITGHPLEKYSDKLEDLHALSTEELCAMKSSTGKDENITTAGIITSIRVLKSKKRRFLRARRARRHVGFR